MRVHLEFGKLEKVEFGGRKGNILSRQLQEIAECFKELYKKFPDYPEDPTAVDSSVSLVFTSVSSC